MHILDSFHELAWSDAPLIAALVVLEALLSADNALIIAVLVKDLPPAQQARATKIGIGFAYLVRFLAVFFVGSLLAYSWVKWLGAAYLIYLGAKGLLVDDDPETKDNEQGLAAWLARTFGLSAFVQAVIAVEIADVIFSIDSITAALAFSPKLAVVFLGGCAGILAMRFVANVFLKLLQSVPALNKTAFLLVLVIGLKLACHAGAFPGVFGLVWFTVDVPIPEWVSFVLLFGLFFGTILGVRLFPNSWLGRLGRPQMEELASDIGVQRDVYRDTP